MVWLYDQAPLVSRMQNTCASRVLYVQSSETSQQFIQNIARRSSLSIRAEQTGDDRLRILADDVRGDRWLAFTQTAACHGFSIENFSVTRIEQTTQVRASMTLIPVAVPRRSE